MCVSIYVCEYICGTRDQYTALTNDGLITALRGTSQCVFSHYICQYVCQYICDG